jgi:hypothetical protein
MERVRDPSPLVIDRVKGCLNAILDAGAYFLELVGNRAAYISDKILCRILGAAGAPRDPATGFLPALRREQKCCAGPKGETNEKRTDSRFSSLDDDVRLDIVGLVFLVVPVILVASRLPPH